MQPLISVNLPTFNRARFIAQAIDSVLRQTFADWELNIVDNCSTDGTWEIVNSYKDPRIRTFRNEENKGMVFSWNRAVELSRGQYVCFLADDDWFAPNRLERLLQFLQSNPDYWGVCDYLVEVDEDGNKIAEGAGFFEAYFNRDVYGGDFHHALVNCINAEAIGLFRRSYFDEVGKFEEGVAFCDYRMHVRNLAKRLRIGSLPEQLHFKRQHADSATANMKDGLTVECFYLFKYVYQEIYLQDHNPKHLVAYIEWLLFQRVYEKIPPNQRRRLLDYVTGTCFPFETFAEFQDYITESTLAVEKTDLQPVVESPPSARSAQADLEHQKFFRELIHQLVERCLATKNDAGAADRKEIDRINEWVVRLNEWVVRLNEEVAFRDKEIALRDQEIVRLNEEITEMLRLRNLNPIRKLARLAREMIRRLK